MKEQVIEGSEQEGTRNRKDLETEDHQDNAMGREKCKLYKGTRRQNY